MTLHFELAGAVAGFSIEWLAAAGLRGLANRREQRGVGFSAGPPQPHSEGFANALCKCRLQLFGLPACHGQSLDVDNFVARTQAAGGRRRIGCHGRLSPSARWDSERSRRRRHSPTCQTSPRFHPPHNLSQVPARMRARQEGF